jgi:hypothetical protein
MSDSISALMEKAFNKVLPIPKTPRIYRSPPPQKPLSWVPHGRIEDPVYLERLQLFANEILAADSQRTNRMKFSSRGWCYVLEGYGKIHKGEFSACQKAINDCRKKGYLPIDFVAEDQDVTRRFRGIHVASEPSIELMELKQDVEKMLEHLPSKTTDYWTEEEYYVMMCVEKGDILVLFEPTCREYHVPIISSKGWSPNNLLIERFGLNFDDIEKYNLTWIENLRSSSGREIRDCTYIDKLGRRKCESNALLKNDETLKAAEEICRNTIEKYYGEDALERFKRKEDQAKERLKEVYDNSIWSSFVEEIGDLINSLSIQPLEENKPDVQHTAEEEFDVFVDNRYYSPCPKCGTSFNHEESDIGKLKRCRFCGVAMRLKWPDGTRAANNIR